MVLIPQTSTYYSYHSPTPTCSHQLTNEIKKESLNTCCKYACHFYQTRLVFGPLNYNSTPFLSACA